MSKAAWFKQIGRLTFLLSSACVGVLGAVAVSLQQSHPDSARVAAAVKAVLALSGVFWVRSLERRLMDAGFPRWFFWPYFLGVSAACAGLLVRGVLDGPETLAFFIVVQIPTVLFPSKPDAARSLGQSGVRAGESEASFPEYNRPVGRFQFLLRVLLICVLFGALLQMAREAGAGVAPWEFRIVIVLIGLAWIYGVEGRVMDAGLPCWISIPYCLLLPGLSVLPHFLGIIGLNSALVLFFVLQIPTIFFRSRAAGRLAGRLNATGKGDPGLATMLSEDTVRQDAGIGGLEFAVYMLLTAGLWYVMHLLRGDVVGARPVLLVVGFALDAGALILCVLWMFSVRERLKNAGLLSWTLDFCLIVFAALLVPLAFRVIGFPQALGLFVALQIPVVFLRHKTASS